MPTPATPVPPLAGAVLRRRTALGGLLALGALAGGCTRETGGEAAASGPASPSPGAVDPDVALAAAALAAEQQMLATLRATAHRHRGLRTVLAGTRDVHRAHVRLLDDAVPTGTPTTTPGQVPEPPAGRDRALAALARAEDRLAENARHWAFDARSGAFARVLASMAAAAAQQSTVLRGQAAGKGAR